MNKQLKDNLKRYEAAHAAGRTIYLEPDEFTDIADYYHQHGRLDEALSTIDEAITMFPGVAAPLAFRARIAILVEKDAGKAKEWAEQIADKSDLEYFYIIAEIKLAEHQPDKANQYLQEKESMVDEDDLEDYYLDVATLFADYGYLKLAAQWLNSSSETDDADYRELQGRIAINQERYKEAEQIFNALIDDDPFDTGYWDFLATAQYLDNQPQASAESSDYALAIDPDDTEALINKANALVLIGNYGEAQGYYEHFMRLEPYNEAGEMGLASVMVAHNRLQEALQHLVKARQLAKTNTGNLLEILRQTCLIQAQLGHTDAARQAINDMEELYGADNEETFTLRGHVCMVRGQGQEALTWFDKALKASHNDTRTIKSIAYDAYDGGLTHYAHQLLRRTMGSEKGRQMPEGWALLCLCDIELGLRGEFLSDLHQAVTLCPDDAGELLAETFPQGLSVTDFERYARLHPELGSIPKQLNVR